MLMCGLVWNAQMHFFFRNHNMTTLCPRLRMVSRKVIILMDSLSVSKYYIYEWWRLTLHCRIEWSACKAKAYLIVNLFRHSTQYAHVTSSDLC